MKDKIDKNAPEPTAGKYDAIIIGSGMSGLVSGVVLAKEGMRVLMLEKHYRIGGYLHRFFRRGGIAFDVGFNSLASFNRVFRKVADQTPTAYRQGHDGAADGDTPG